MCSKPRDRERYFCAECFKTLRAKNVIRFQGRNVCGVCLVAECELPKLEHYVYTGISNLGRAIEAGPTEALIHDIRISDYHSASEMYYRIPSMIVPPYRLSVMYNNARRSRVA